MGDKRDGVKDLDSKLRADGWINYAPDDLPEGYEDTTRYKRLPSGAVMDKSTNKLVANPGGGNTIIRRNSNNIREIHAERVLKAKLAAQSALAAVSASKSKTSLAGWARIVGAQAELALDIDRGRASTDAARFVGQAAGFLESGRQADDNGRDAGTMGAVSILAGALSQFLAAASSKSTTPDIIIDSDWVKNSDDTT